tara:strand:- start:142 stop:321 length:180 start_codon:yes stop_codon:yes gene_type:complete
MAEQDEAIQEIQSKNKHQALQKIRMNTIKEVAGLLGIQELKWIYTEIHNMIEDIERKNK